MLSDERVFASRQSLLMAEAVFPSVNSTIFYLPDLGAIEN